MENGKLRFLVLKALQANEGSGGQLDYSKFDATEAEIDDVIRYLDDRELIKGVFYADDRPYETSGVSLTEKGEDYLKNKSKLYGS